MKEKIILFGAGNFGRSAFEKFSSKHKILCFADNKASIVGKNILGVPVIAPDAIVDWLDENTDVVISSCYYKEMSIQLEDLGISDYYIYTDNALFPKPIPKAMKEICRCTRCIMDNSSDNTIFFSVEGYCNYCTSAIYNIGKVYFPNEEGNSKLKALVEKVKADGKGKKYDCIMGLSGGLDSSYLTYLGYKLGLRILIIHIDDGFDTEISIRNFNKLIAKTGFDYEVVKPDMKQYADLTLSFMRAGLPNIAIPQDNLILAYIYKKLQEYNINYFLSGGNFALECILQKGNTYTNLDVDHIKNVHKKFGMSSIDKLEFISAEQVEEVKESMGIETLKPLDLIDYNRDRAFKELGEFCGFEYYGRKHLENYLTAFVQLYWFPKKFGVDKRTSHLSSMIATGQMTREQALKEFAEPLYQEKEMEQIINIVKTKFDISDDEFEKIMAAPTHQHNEYK